MPPSVRRDGPSDKTIVRRARQGDRAAFLSLIRRYDPRLRRLALQLLADPKRLDRVLNRAYLKAWRSLPFLKRGEPAAKWLYRIVYNTCLNEVRWEPSRTPPAPPQGERVPLPAAPAERRLLALRALSPDERVPLVMVDGEGFGVEDAARMLNRPADEVADDLTRARGRWRAFVMGEPEPPPPPERKKAQVPPPEESDGYEPWPVTLPVQLTTRTTLASLAAPHPQREPGGHVKVLADHDVELVAQAPAADHRSDRQPHDLNGDDPPAAGNGSTNGNGTKAKSRSRGSTGNADGAGNGAKVRSGGDGGEPGDGGGTGNGAKARSDRATGDTADAAGGTKARSGRSRGAPTGRPPSEGGPSGPPSTGARRRSRASTGETPAVGDVPSDDTAEITSPGRPLPAGGSGGGAGARRKRRRDAKRASANARTRDRSGGVKPPAGRTAPDHDPSNETP